MNTELVDGLLKALKPAIKNLPQAEHLLERYWADKIALIWTTADVHRAANEVKTVITEEDARAILHDLHLHYNPQFGIHWRDLSEIIRDSGKGRDITRAELTRFILQNRVAIQRQ
jgi:hypothetical protein